MACKMSPVREDKQEDWKKSCDANYVFIFVFHLLHFSNFFSLDTRHNTICIEEKRV
jgi:hypothetical protein